MIKKTIEFCFICCVRIPLLDQTCVSRLQSYKKIIISWTTVNIRKRFIFYYRPHPKDGEGKVFTGVCLCTAGGGGTPSHVQRGVPWPGPRGLPQPCQDRGGTPGQGGKAPVPEVGYPPPGPEVGYSPIQRWSTPPPLGG